MARVTVLLLILLCVVGVLSIKPERGGNEYEEEGKPMEDVLEDSHPEPPYTASHTSTNNNEVSMESPPYHHVHRVPPADSGFRTFDAASLDSPKEAEEMMRFFEEEGYLVLDNVLSPAEVQTAEDKFALLMKAADGVDMKKPTIESFDLDFSDPENGIAGHSGVGHSSMNWFVRSRERVQQAFASVNGAKYSPPGPGRTPTSHDKLITSFDGLNFFRNPEVNPDWTSSLKSWLHFDASMPDHTEYVQGVVNLIDCTDDNDAGPVLFPRSHKTVFPTIVQAYPSKTTHYSQMGPKFWNTVRENRTAVQGIGTTRAFRVPMKAGSLLIWGSGTMHCNIGPLPRTSEKFNKDQFVRRLVSYVSMMKDPRDAELTAERWDHFHHGRTLAHQADLRGNGGFRDNAPRELVAAGAVIVRDKDLPGNGIELI